MSEIYKKEKPEYLDLALKSMVEQTLAPDEIVIVKDGEITKLNNAAQYYPDYAYNHPLFTPDMKMYSDSTISDFFRSINENQRQNFLDCWNEERYIAWIMQCQKHKKLC